MSRIKTFAERLTSGETLAGTFVKTPSPIVCEVLGLSDLDVCCLDVEHAPFGRLELDSCIAQLKAADLPSLVRVANDSATEIRNALDSGASGILVPHVVSVEQAQQIVQRAHFGEGGRGYSGSTRAGGYGTKPMADHIDASREHTIIIVQIEDLAALEQVAGIAAVDGVHGVFIGRVDLAVAMRRQPQDDEVMAAVSRICDAVSEQACVVGMFLPSPDEVSDWRAKGVNLFLLNSDQGLLLQAANRCVGEVKS